MVRLLATSVPLGAFAGTATAHPHTPDSHTGTSCLLCFGWCNDPRHGGHKANRTPANG